MSLLSTARKYPFLSYIYLQSAALAALTWFLLRGFYHDDAYISLRYARNLVDGLGMTWNPGERVEGYTNFLLVALEAALGTLGIDLVTASRLINVAAFFGTIAVLAHFLKPRLAESGPAYSSALALGVTISAVPLLAWCMGGLEPDLFAFLLTAAICACLEIINETGSRRTAALAGTLFALATLARPEGGAFFGLAAAFFLATHRKDMLPPLALSYAAILLPYTLWRIHYFGELLPNTYYAKSYGIPLPWKLAAGGFYLLQYAVMPPLLPCFCLGLPALALFQRRLTPPLAFLALLLGLDFAVVMLEGGDYMPYFRFLAPAVPIMALLIYYGLLPLAAKRLREVGGALLFFLALQPGLVQETGLSAGALSGLAVAPYISAHWPQGSTIALNPAGALPYAAPQFRYIDMLGLLDKTIARRRLAGLRAAGQGAAGHFKGDGAYVFSRRPDYIIFGLAWGSDKPVFLSDLELTEQPGFAGEYRKVEIYITPPPALLPQLISMASGNAEGLKLNAGHQLRFVYYRRIR